MGEEIKIVLFSLRAFKLIPEDFFSGNTDGALQFINPAMTGKEKNNENSRTSTWL